MLFSSEDIKTVLTVIISDRQKAGLGANALKYRAKRGHRKI